MSNQAYSKYPEEIEASQLQAELAFWLDQSRDCGGNCKLDSESSEDEKVKEVEIDYSDTPW